MVYHGLLLNYKVNLTSKELVMSNKYWVGDPTDLQHYQPECPTETPPEIDDITWERFGAYPAEMVGDSHVADGPAFDNSLFYACQDEVYQYTIICWGSMMGSTYHVMRMPKNPDNH